LPSALSGGEQQRVAIARALANDPPILVADEPTGNLDSRTAVSVLELFERLVAQDKTILMVTHDRDLSKRAGRIITLADGEIVAETTADRRLQTAEMLRQPSSVPTGSLSSETLEDKPEEFTRTQEEDRHA
jgi:putative ABC transport system ATP-binding protein